ncbi:MAG: NINE protein [Bacteroidales bacterium]|nr:NINE protein [Bacteroidales bacterium]MDD4684988.1 NINE protein [Bacteroidales bacterium]
MDNLYEKYCYNCGAVIDKKAEICPKCGVRQTNLPNSSANINVNVNQRWLITILLCGFLGIFGAHRFYTNHILSGVLQLITFGGLGIWWLVDFIFILVGQFKDKEGNYIKMQNE